MCCNETGKNHSSIEKHGNHRCPVTGKTRASVCGYITRKTL